MFREFWDDVGSKALKFAWCALLTLSMGTTLFDGTLQKNLTVISNITVWMVAQNLAIIVVVISAFVVLTKVHPVFKWSWFSLFRTQEDEVAGRESEGTNINIMPMHIKYFGLVFALLLMANLPSFAMTEEKWFRAGTDNWLEGLYVSFLFGILHCLVGVPIGAGVAITLCGVWFTHQYFLGGIELSALHHTTYNLIFISVLFLFLVLKHVIEFSEGKS